MKRKAENLGQKIVVQLVMQLAQNADVVSALDFLPLNSVVSSSNPCLIRVQIRG
jgi:hypothetical protein